jgi:predicted acetyltransferase
VERLTYRGDIWQGAAVHPDLWALLLRRDLLIEIATSPPPYQVILGVPHHAGPGVEKIAEDWINPQTAEPGRAADETTGLTGLAVLEAFRQQGISARLVIAAHARDHDPNKSPGSPYWEAVFSGAPAALLFELHGSAHHRPHDLELSAGHNTLVDPMLYGQVLAYFLRDDTMLACQTAPGARDARIFASGRRRSARLQTPALGTHSLKHAATLGMPALHLEMKPAFRQPDFGRAGTPRPAARACALAHGLASMVRLLHQSSEVRIDGSVAGLSTTAFLTRPSMRYAASYLEAALEALPAEQVDNPELQVRSIGEVQLLVEHTRSVNYYPLPDHPPEEFLWLIDQGECIGRAFFLHWLNAFRLQTDGQVDYWIRPSRRRQGYGKILLQLLLARFGQLGLKRVLISCRSNNLASRKIIESANGVYESEIITQDADGVLYPRRRYWINLRRVS